MAPSTPNWVLWTLRIDPAVKFTYPRRPLMIYFALIIDIEKLGTREAEKSRILPKIRIQVGFGLL